MASNKEVNWHKKRNKEDKGTKTAGSKRNKL
jgi:hypothetical protein